MYRIAMPDFLFHISEQAGIERFEPRPHSRFPDAVVWAIDDARMHTYMLPRDCPRIALFPQADTMDKDKLRFMGSTTAPCVLAIESAWLERAMRHRLYQYTLPAATFTLEDEVAGHYISRQPVSPIDMQVIEQPLLEMVKRNVELRVMPSLWELREAVVGSTMNFSITRMRNASPAPAGFVSKYPAQV
jgi:hypothetical protein